MRILYFRSPATDYLADSLLHGLRRLLGAGVVDYPKHDLMYCNCPLEFAKRIHGKGFTLYRLLEDISVDRTQIGPKLQAGYFDLVVISNIWMGFGTLVDWWPELLATKTVILDGCDSPQLYPYSGKWLKERRRWFLPRAHQHFLYFKREWTPATLRSRYYNLVPEKLAAWLPTPVNLRPIPFSIPPEKIVAAPLEKKKKFAQHLVDPEAAARFGGSTQGVFATEADYFHDLQTSMFAVTTKRSGWDCLRHYEIAANGCVPCFRDLDHKPATCAPHDLNRDNCIIYHSVDDLERQIAGLSPAAYQVLQQNALNWARRNSSVAAARRFLEACNLPLDSAHNDPS
jgi:hypothetical protein